MTSPTPPLLFLAHARADADLVVKVRRAAWAAGLRLWSESTDLPPDEPVLTTLTRVIRECRVFAVLLTTRSVQRAWVRWELEHAFSIGKAPVVPIIGEPNLDLPPPFDRFRPDTYLTASCHETLASHLAAISAADKTSHVSPCI